MAPPQGETNIAMPEEEKPEETEVAAPVENKIMGANATETGANVGRAIDNAATQAQTFAQPYIDGGKEHVPEAVKDAAVQTQSFVGEKTKPIMEKGKDFIPSNAEQVGTAFGKNVDTGYEAAKDQWEKHMPKECPMKQMDVKDKEEQMNGLLEGVVQMTMNTFEAARDTIVGIATGAADKSTEATQAVQDKALETKDAIEASDESLVQQAVDVLGSTIDGAKDMASQTVQTATGFVGDRANEIKGATTNATSFVGTKINDTKQVAGNVVDTTTGFVGDRVADVTGGKDNQETVEGAGETTKETIDKGMDGMTDAAEKAGEAVKGGVDEAKAAQAKQVEQ